jgi:alpha-D-ribose 1-methylphosphonate 5-triphosphate synthase subunit PhnG
VNASLLAQGLAAAARVRRDALIALADETAAAYAVDLTEAPAPNSVLLEVESAAGSFYLTEVVITAARVRVEGRDGYGCVLGWDAGGALAGALCDAAAPHERERVALLAQEALDAEAADRQAHMHAIEATRV